MSLFSRRTERTRCPPKDYSDLFNLRASSTDETATVQRADEHQVELSTRQPLPERDVLWSTRLSARRAEPDRFVGRSLGQRFTVLRRGDSKRTFRRYAPQNGSTIVFHHRDDAPRRNAVLADSHTSVSHLEKNDWRLIGGVGPL